ncbi:MAG: phospholipase D-like domain-containing protein [Xanthomonadaceae bacterium]|nr:phospholipase D-like domain-containing protein [Xanthomonadaceae bacterium]
METRTAPGTVAWIVSLNTFPYVAVPAYWVFGRSEFEDYVLMRRERVTSLNQALASDLDSLRPFRTEWEGADEPTLRAVEQLARLPFVSGNSAELLVDGPATYESIFAGIDAAEDYVLVQYYIVRDDGVGRELQRRLIERAQDGVRVHLLMDGVGSADLSSRGDGWRDAHMRIEGPAVLHLQLSFLEDWRWVTSELPAVSWTPHAPAGATAPILILPTGPADRFETGSLMVQQFIHLTKRRIWISSPYFVPDEGVIAALKLAALGGVDVRLMLPERSDSRLATLAAETYMDPLIAAGVRIYRYQPGFMHAKRFLIDDHGAAVSTVNLDNRSFRLNFELTALVADASFAAEVERMFVADFADSREMVRDEFANKPLWFRLSARAANLFAPAL